MSRGLRAGAGLAGIAAAGAVAAWATYPAVGRLTYRIGAGAETRLRGFRSHRAQVAGWPVAYYEAGPCDRPAVVLLHGFSGDRDLWVRFGSHLRRDYRVIIPDLAGHGATGFVAGADYSAPGQAALVVGLLDALGIERAHVMGNSMGGFVAAHVAAGHPGRTVSVGLCNASGVIGPNPSSLDRMLASGRNPFLLTDTDQFAAFYALTMAQPPYLPRIVLAARAREYVERREELAEVFVDHHHRNLLDEALDSIAVPALVMWGSEDPLVDPSAAAVWTEGLPDATLIVYPGVGHMPMVEIPDRSAADYAAFLKRVGSAARPSPPAGPAGSASWSAQ
jgi:pimeloyl-ACP methyl ester carboxylesterase